MSPPEVVVMGRLSADIYPTELRTSLRHQRNFIRYVGGFAGNVCTGLSRLQVGTAIVSKGGKDGPGEVICDFLSGWGLGVGAAAWAGSASITPSTPPSSSARSGHPIVSPCSSTGCRPVPTGN